MFLLNLNITVIYHRNDPMPESQPPLFRPRKFRKLSDLSYSLFCSKLHPHIFLIVPDGRFLISDAQIVP